MRSKPRRALALILAAGLIAALFLLPDTLRGLSLVIRAAGMQEGWAGRLGRLQTGPFDVSEL